MTRAGLTNLLTRLRGMAQAGTADYTVAGTTYWSDAQLAERLELDAAQLIDQPLRPVAERAAGGSVVYREYRAGWGDLEEATSGTIYWRVTDALGAIVGTANYTVNYAIGHIRFNADTGGSAYYLTARSYNLNLAAARVWREKAAHAATGYDFQTNDQQFSRSQLFRQCLAMAEFYEALGGGGQARMVRRDLT